VTPGPCPVQDPEVASACGAEGRVVFDGRYCNFAAGPECGGERGAFATFEACAISCEAAGHCNEGVVRTNRGPQWPTCELVPGAECECGIIVSPPTDLSACTGFGLDLGCEFIDIDRRWTCWRAQGACYPPEPRDTPAEHWLFFRRASLLPFLDRLGCEQWVGP
jgi:hypothetical protein